MSPSEMKTDQKLKNLVCWGGVCNRTRSGRVPEQVWTRHRPATGTGPVNFCRCERNTNEWNGTGTGPEREPEQVWTRPNWWWFWVTNLICFYCIYNSFPVIQMSMFSSFNQALAAVSRRRRPVYSHMLHWLWQVSADTHGRLKSFKCVANRAALKNSILLNCVYPV